MPQEFQICVTPVGQDNYLVRTEQVALGVPMAEELVQLPVEAWLNQSEQLLAGDRSLSLHQNTANCLVTLGQQLYAALFQGSLRLSWQTAQKIAQQQQVGLRLRLGLMETRLAYLPWEVLHTGDRFLACDPAIAISRYQVITGVRGRDAIPRVCKGIVGQLTTPSLPPAIVKVLLVIATPNAETSFAVKQAAIGLELELCQSQPATELEFALIEEPDLEQLIPTLLTQEDYQIIHYIGPRQLTPDVDEIGRLLSRNGIQMAVFNFTPSTGLTDITEADLTQNLIKHGINSVLTLKESASDEVMLTLIRQFYRHLSQGNSIDFSLNQVRAEIVAAGELKQNFWTLPVLYLQPECDGYLVNDDLTLPAAPYTNDTYFSSAPDSLIDSIAELDLDEAVWDDLVDVEAEDPTYQEDSAVVADLFQQLANTQESGVKNQELEGETISNSQGLSSNSEFRIAVPTFPKRWMVAGAVGVPAIALLGLCWQYRPSSRQEFFPPIYQSFIGQPFEVELKATSTSGLTAIAIEKSKADLGTTYLAIEELLNRGQLPRAGVALAAVSQQQAQTSEINFLLGRFAWQSAQHGDKRFKLEDACRYWEEAVKSQPNSPKYYNALGFAYYALGNLERANQTWFQALYLIEEQQAAKPTTSNHSATTLSLTDRVALNAYAGLALVLQQTALSQPPEQQVKLLNKAVQLRQKVLTNDSINFHPQNLSKNWLWTEPTIQDWRSLLQRPSQKLEARDK